MSRQLVRSSMDEQATKRLVDAMRGGTDIETASAFAGMSLTAVSELIARGQLESERLDAGLEADPDNAEGLALWREVFRARAEAVVRAVAQIQKAANQGDWKAAAWWLERAMPETYTPKQVREKQAMPTYEYKCEEGHVVTVTRKIDEAESFPVCGICTEPMKRVFNAPPVVFNGSGWGGKPEQPQG